MKIGKGGGRGGKNTEPGGTTRKGGEFVDANQNRKRKDPPQKEATPFSRGGKGARGGTGKCLTQEGKLLKKGGRKISNEEEEKKE